MDDAIAGVDFYIPNYWVSMGEPAEVWKERVIIASVSNKRIMFWLKQVIHVKVLHCLPAFHNRDTKVGEEMFQKFGLDAMEITEDVFESEASIVFDEAENRLHSIKSNNVATLA